MGLPQFNLDEIRLIPLVSGKTPASEIESLRGDFMQEPPRAVSVNLSQLTDGMSALLAQMNSILGSVKTSVGQFQPNEVEVSAGISASGEITLLCIAGGEAGIEGAGVYVRRPNVLFA